MDTEVTEPPRLPLFDLIEGERRKAEGVARALSSERRAEIRERVASYIVELANTGREFTSDGVYALADESGDPFPDGVNMGSVFVAASKAGLIFPVWAPAQKSKRPNRHAGKLSVWIGKR